jgi:hypothetical protein
MSKYSKRNWNENSKSDMVKKTQTNVENSDRTAAQCTSLFIRFLLIHPLANERIQVEHITTETKFQLDMDTSDNSFFSAFSCP